MSASQDPSTTRIAPRSSSHPPDQDNNRAPVQKKKRIINALAACNSCRKRKSRCNGARPTCDACARRGQDCTWDVEPGFRKREAERRKLDNLKAEHQDLKKVMRQIRDGSPQQIEEILKRLRDGEIDGIEAMAATRAVRDSDSSSISVDSEMEDAYTRSSGPKSTSMDEAPSKTSSRHNSHVVPAPYIDVPDRDVFEVAVTAYHSTVGDLFHTYTPAQAKSLLDAVFQPGQPVQPSSALTQICSIAAVGSMYCRVAPPLKTTEYFYSIARNDVDSLIGEDGLSAAKVILMLALCNMVYKSTVAMSYLNLGLCLSRRNKFNPTQRPADVDLSQWSDHKRVWRTLILCNGWMVSTTGIAAKLCWAESHSILQSLSLEQNMPLRDVIQLELAKIATLKANMLSTLSETHNVDQTIFAQIRCCLREWCENLPNVMSLNTLIGEGIVDDENRIKILYAHLVYLGGMMLLPRCLARRWLDSQATAEDLSSTDAVAGFHEGFIAAQQTTRILGLLRAEQGVMGECWLCTFHSYNSTLMVLFELCQELLLYETVCTERKVLLELAESAMECLHFCSLNDHTASALYSLLQPHFAVVKKGQKRIEATTSVFSKSERLYHPFYVPPGDSELHHTTNILLGLMSQSFDVTSTSSSPTATQHPKQLPKSKAGQKVDLDQNTRPLPTPPAEISLQSWISETHKSRSGKRVLFPFSSVFEPQMPSNTSVKPSNWVDNEIGGHGAELVASRLFGAW